MIIASSHLLQACLLSYLISILPSNLWLQPITSCVMQHELNLEVDNSRDKLDKNQVLLSFKVALYSKHKLG